MKLQEYLKKEGIAPHKLAKDAGINTTTIYLFINGKRGLRTGTAKLIEEFTGGKVTRLELLYPEEY